MTTITVDTRIVTLKEASEILKISLSKVYHEWPSWREKGVRVLKLKPNDNPRFYLADILRMAERAK